MSQATRLTFLPCGRGGVTRVCQQFLTAQQVQGAQGGGPLRGGRLSARGFSHGGHRLAGGGVWLAVRLLLLVLLCL